ncbi:MAG: GNAT family N-acetyltransferase [Actinobacteria bacterium]|nr:GNAT family N-acetyltransferase [Actinomycetota bacterium]
MGDCPEESARLVVAADRDDLEALRAEARATVVGARGGRALLSRDHPIDDTDALVDAAVAGRGDAVVIVGLLDDMAVGFMLARRVASSDGAVLELVGAWVTPEARGIGVGAVMMTELIAWGRHHGCVELDAEALPGDRDTKNFYELNGLVARQITVSRRLD